MEGAARQEEWGPPFFAQPNEPIALSTYIHATPNAHQATPEQPPSKASPAPGMGNTFGGVLTHTPSFFRNVLSSQHARPSVKA